LGLILNVYVIYNSSEFTKEQVVHELEQEDYKHNFFFGNEVIELDKRRKAMIQSDEVWIFGKCDFMQDTIMAEQMVKDRWQMG